MSAGSGAGVDGEIEPLPEERLAAREQPGGWLYRIAGAFRDDERIPPEAIFGAWEIDERGNIVGEFIRNANYDPVRYPPPAPREPSSDE